MDEHSSWQLSEVPHSSCPRPWCIDLHNVRFQFWNSESFYDIIVYGITDARSCSFDSRSIIGFLGALKNNTILLWIVSLFLQMIILLYPNPIFSCKTLPWLLTCSISSCCVLFWWQFWYSQYWCKYFCCSVEVYSHPNFILDTW